MRLRENPRSTYGILRGDNYYYNLPRLTPKFENDRTIMRDVNTPPGRARVA